MSFFAFSILYLWHCIRLLNFIDKIIFNVMNNRKTNKKKRK